MKVLFLLPYPLGRAPSQRFRVEKLLQILDAEDIKYDLKPFMDEKVWNAMYHRGAPLKKIAGVLKGYLSRLYTLLFEARHYDKIFIHREAAPLGPPVFEWYIAKILKKPIIYDFDDAIWMPNVSDQNRTIMFIKAFWKVAFICKWANSISAGNKYLVKYAESKSAGKVIVMPTVVDTILQYNSIKKHSTDKVVIGWTGSHSTLKYLESIVPVLQKLQQEIDFVFLVIADENPELPLNNMEFIPWNAATEISDLLRIDIGIMPLVTDLWSEGKCGFKLIQYLSLGIPAIADPVGVNKEIIENGTNGYLCNTPDEWFYCLKKLINDTDLRMQFGQNGREKIVNSYSILSNTNNFLSLFK